MRRSLPLLLLAAAGGCGDSKDPLEVWPLDAVGVQLSITVDRSVVAAGDSVVFTASAFNPTSKTVQIGQHCGPSFDVLVTRPTGTESSVMREMLGPSAVFNCLLGPWHIAEAGETEEQFLRWETPDEAGVYWARATLRRDELYLSDPVRVEVR